MNLKLVYIAVGIVAAGAVAAIVFMFVGNIFSANILRGQGLNQGALTEAASPQLSLKDITVSQQNNKTADIEIVFDAHNPNKSTIILEAIQYNILVNGSRIVSGDIGAKPEGFVASQEGIYPIIGNGSIILKDKQSSVRSSSIADTWDSIVAGKARYLVSGTFSYKQTSSLQSSSGDKNFELSFP